MDQKPDLEARLAKLERDQALLRGFVLPAYWSLVDRLYARTPLPETAACLACGFSQKLARFARRHDACVFGGAALERLACPKCGCVFGPLKYLQTPPEVVEADYRLLYAHYSEGDSTEQEIRAFHALQPKPGGLYLNWGSGAWSASVDRLRAEGWDVWGYEPHAEVTSPFVVRNKGEISARFDGIFSNNVIEHLFDPLAQFAEFKGYLKPDGRMAHASPCYDWLYAFTRFHVFFPLGEAPRRLAERSGFSLVGAEDDGEFKVRVFQARP
ncbi:MAG: methyltransferase [Caulobacteraceae bacterium]|nr:methyltransferase [Caulobacteraceae bacterium]